LLQADSNQDFDSCYFVSSCGHGLPSLSRFSEAKMSVLDIIFACTWFFLLSQRCVDVTLLWLLFLLETGKIQLCLGHFYAAWSPFRAERNSYSP